MKANIQVRFSELDLHEKLLSRIVFNNIVIDHELISRNFPEGKGTIEMLCIYHVENGFIKKAQFHTSNKMLL